MRAKAWKNLLRNRCPRSRWKGRWRNKRWAMPILLRRLCAGLRLRRGERGHVGEGNRQRSGRRVAINILRAEEDDRRAEFLVLNLLGHSIDDALLLCARLGIL